MIRVPSLVAHYKLDGNANDSSGNGLHGEFNVNIPTQAEGVFGNSYKWNNLHYEGIVVPYAPELNTPYLTSCVWVKVDYPSSGSYRALFGRGLGSGWGDFIHNLQTAIQFRIWSSGVAKNANIVGIPLGIWTHFAFVFDGTRLIIFRNGKSATVSGFSGSIDATGMRLGIGKLPDRAEHNSNNYNYDGSINDLQIYSKPLPESDIRRIMLGLHPLNG